MSVHINVISFNDRVRGILSQAGAAAITKAQGCPWEEGDKWEGPLWLFMSLLSAGGFTWGQLPTEGGILTYATGPGQHVTGQGAIAVNNTGGTVIINGEKWGAP